MAEGGKGALLGLFYEIVNPFQEGVPHSYPNTLPMTSPPNTITFGDQVLMYEFWGWQRYSGIDGMAQPRAVTFLKRSEKLQRSRVSWQVRDKDIGKPTCLCTDINSHNLSTSICWLTCLNLQEKNQMGRCLSEHKETILEFFPSFSMQSTSQVSVHSLR